MVFFRLPLAAPDLCKKTIVSVFWFGASIYVLGLLSVRATSVSHYPGHISILFRWSERLFEPFWSEKADGLGIGLYHARLVITGVGGTFQALTPPQKPITFVV